LKMLDKVLAPAFLLALCLQGAVSIKAESLDSRLYYQIHDRWQHPSLDRPMELASRMGDAKMGIALCAGVGLFGGERARQTAKLALAADALSAGLAWSLKMAVNRQRPDGPTTRSNSSFPSGHATGAFALATAFSHSYPKITIPAYLGAAAIGLSRVYLGRHYPADVLAGALIGYATARFVIRYREKVLALKFPGIEE